jgi:peptidoglycan hydrolase-like protein with peptidoglycan-binding domain
MDIQTALKNAGYYAGKIDGKIGPMSKKAIEDFQKANGLTADGKVGPKTWAVLGKYLTTTATASSGQVQ